MSSIWLRRCLAVGALAIAVLTGLVMPTAVGSPATAFTGPVAPVAPGCGLGSQPAVYHGSSDLRNLRRAVPDPLKVVSYPCPFPTSLHGIDLGANSIKLVVGGRLARSISFPHGGQSVSLPQVIDAIADRSWISMDSRGVVVLNASLVQEPGTNLLVSAPVTAVRIVNNEDASIAGSRATARFSGVTVTSWDPKKKSPVMTAVRGRPFVVYENGSRFSIDHSLFAYLGSDISSSYGVSWRQGGTTGTVTRSTFAGNFFGVYTYEANKIIFEHNVFRDNVFYGMDPHTYSTNLTIRYNDVYGSGDHGIVFSRFVTNSVVAGNDVHDNKVNGIMMDYHSNGNTIRDNIVRDNGQGIVLSGSANNQVYGNTVTGNEVGVRASHDGADVDKIHDNSISGGRIGIKLYDGATQMSVRNNVIRGATDTGVLVDAPQTTLAGNTISGTATAVSVQTVATLTGGSVSGARTGIEVADQGIADISAVGVAADVPIIVLGNGYVHLTSTGFRVPRLGGALSASAVLGTSFLGFAVLCELIHALRGRRLRRLQVAWVGVNAFSPRPAGRVRGRGGRLVVREAKPPGTTHPGAGDDLRHEPEDSGARSDEGLRSFRPDVEGLRAIAVGSVVASHASLGLDGGFVGVDVFFVISGFLITRQLVEERRRRGRISFTAFYARRARRILPAATLVTIATLVLAMRWASPLRVASIARDGIAAALFGVNWRLAARGTDYFNATAPPTPFQHYWSLSVEEQFYVAWPVVLVLISLVFAKKFGVTKPPLVVLTAIVAVSLWQSIKVTAANGPYAYFGTHTRVWELAMGALVAVGAPALVRLPASVSRTLAWAGLVAIVAGCFVFDAGTPYPGTAALLPVLGAAAIIAAGCGPQVRLSPESVILKRRFMQFVGKISYSLYLWHWPLLVLAPDILGRNLTLTDRLVAVGIAVLLSVLTFILVEQPMRRQTALVRRARRAGVFAAALITASVVSALVISSVVALPGGDQPASSPVAAAAIRQLTTGTDVQTTAQIDGELNAAAQLKSLPPDVTPSLSQAPSNFPDTQGCEVGLTATAPKLPCNQFGDTRSGTQVVLTGDSHAGMWLDAINTVAMQHHWRLSMLSKSGCPVGDYQQLVNEQLKRVYRECNAWRPRMIAAVQRLRPAMVIIGSEAHDIASADPNGLVSSISRLRASGAKVVFLADTPTPRVIGDIPDCLAKNLNDVSSCNIPRDQAGLDAPGRTAEIQAAQQAGASVVDPAPWMCTPQLCPAVIQSEIVYADASHITAVFGQLRAPQLGAAFTEVISR